MSHGLNEFRIFWLTCLTKQTHLFQLLNFHQSEQSQYISMEICLLSSTCHGFDLHTAFVICISISLGFPHLVSISLGFPCMVVLQPFKQKHHCSRYSVAIGCYGRRIVPGASIVTSQCYGCYCFTEYANSRRPQAAKQSIICRISMRFVVHFCGIIPYI